jgi:ferric-dicitrate binding protein FerR (iron transport regulator)
LQSQTGATPRHQVAILRVGKMEEQLRSRQVKPQQNKKKISPAKAQRRKEKPFRTAAALCAFAPLRERSSPLFVQS